MAKKTFALRVRQLAILRLSASQIAEKLGTHPSYVRRILARSHRIGRPVTKATVERARRILASVDDLSVK